MSGVQSGVQNGVQNDIKNDVESALERGFWSAKDRNFKHARTGRGT